MSEKPKKGRPAKIKFTENELTHALFLWATMPQAEALEAIGLTLGKWPDRNRMNYLSRKHDI